LQSGRRATALIAHDKKLSLERRSQQQLQQQQQQQQLAEAQPGAAHAHMLTGHNRLVEISSAHGIEHLR